MTAVYFTIRTFLHYWRQNLTTALGVAISTAVLAGGLIIGDSVRHSLEKGASMRLGRTEFAVSGTDRIFTAGMADRLAGQIGRPCVPVLRLQGSASADGGRMRLNRIVVNGVDGRFDAVRDSGRTDPIRWGYGDLGDNEVIISENLASRLALSEGDYFVCRMMKASVFPMNTPFVSSENTTVPLRVRVSRIARAQDLGRFSTGISQTAPYNVFINLEQLNRLMGLSGRANLILVCGDNTPSAEAVQKALKQAMIPADAGLKIRMLPQANAVELRSERVFLEQSVVDAIQGWDEKSTCILTYFVNAFRYRDRQTPYSFVSTMEGPGKDGIIINDWLAGDLGIGTGDSLDMDYFVPGPLRKLEEHTIRLKVKGIRPMEGAFADRTLIPDLPGLSDAGHCSDWQAGVPIDLEKIRNKDEEYWNRYRGTPKAFISPETAIRIWKNRFGSFTAIRFPGNAVSADEVAGVLKKNLDPSELGFSVRPVREQGMQAAREGVDFSQLFLSLSFFVLVSALILTLLMFQINLHVRISQAGTLASLGYPDKRIRRIYLGEAAVTAITGSIPGIFLAILFTRGVFFLLGSLWSDIVRTSILEISVRPLTLLTGCLCSAAISWLGIFFVLARKLKKPPVNVRPSRESSGPVRPSLRYRVIVWTAFAAGTGIILWQAISGSDSGSAAFMAAGGLILVFFVLVQDLYFSGLKDNGDAGLTVRMMVLKNAGRNRLRRFAIILLFATGTFSIVITGANRRGSVNDTDEKSGGTGGFDYYAESTVPVLFDLNDETAGKKAGIEGNYSFVQFRRNNGDDASCLNLNRVNSPALIGTDPSGLEGRFTFVSGTGDLDRHDPWRSIDTILQGGALPAVADQTVIQWGLGRKIGDTLYYMNEAGDRIMVKLVGGIAPSVLQGNVIISDRNFLKQYPSSSGNSIYLIDLKRAGVIDPVADLTRAFRNNGWYITRSSDRLAEFESVQNTYLSIFTMLGILALLLGTCGLGILLVRDVMERRNEIGLYQSLGYGRGRIFRILFWEYFVLISAGIFPGFISGMIATFPQMVSVGYAQVAVSLLLIMVILLVNSIGWITGFVRTGINKPYEKLLGLE